jgi:hypothetical protein
MTPGIAPWLSARRYDPRVVQPMREGSMPARTGPRLTDLLLYLVGVAVLVGALTVAWRSMRAVMDIGGMCASGGPYHIAVRCPEGVDILLIVAIPVGLLAVGMIAWFGSRIGPGFASVAALAWPALFLSLGWNFLEYGLAATGGWDWAWLICGVLFVAMGGIPLLVAIRGMPRGDRRSSGPTWAARPAASSGGAGVTVSMGGIRPSPGLTYPSERASSDATPQHVGLASLLRQVQGMTVAEAAGTTVAEATRAGDPAEAGEADPPAGMVEQLERLARLKERGALGELEYLQAKQAVIDAAAKGGTA